MAQRVERITAQRLRLVRGGGVVGTLFGGTLFVIGVYLFGGVLRIFPMQNPVPVLSSDALQLLAFAVVLAVPGGTLAFFRRWITIDLAARRLTRRYGFAFEQLAVLTQTYRLGDSPKVKVVHEHGGPDSGSEYHVYVRSHTGAEPILIFTATSVAERKRAFWVIWNFLKGSRNDVLDVDASAVDHPIAASDTVER